MEVTAEKATLRNGMDVIVHEDHTVPLVGISVWYRAGSRDESPARTGLAHFVEHIMFEAAQVGEAGFLEAIEETGGRANGSVGLDRTVYWELVPSEALAVALELEAERMRSPPAPTAERVEKQRCILRNELQQTALARPYGRAQWSLAAGLFPGWHPYSWPAQGHPEHLEDITANDVREFTGRFYGPSNASLAIAGDVNSRKAFETVEALFGSIPARRRNRSWSDILDIGRRAATATRLEQAVQLPRLYLAWRTAGILSGDDALLTLLATIVVGPRTSRLYRELVHRRGLAVDVGGGQQGYELSGVFQIVVTAAAGVDLDDLEAIVLDEMERVTAEGVSEEEVSLGVRMAESSLRQRVERVGGARGRADQLNLYNVVCGDAQYWRRDVARYRAGSPAGVQGVAGRWLKAEECVTVQVVPRADERKRVVE